MSEDPPFSIDANWIDIQRGFSETTFGPGDRLDGVIDHIRKEINEVIDAHIQGEPELEEWIDIVILAIDGAWRSGASPQEICDAYVAKMVKNLRRKWPDWRTAEPGKAIEHDRSFDDDLAEAYRDNVEQGAVVPALRHPREWAFLAGLEIKDPDGWQRDGKDFNEHITLDEFKQRIIPSTVVHIADVKTTLDQPPLPDSVELGLEFIDVDKAPKVSLEGKD